MKIVLVLDKSQKASIGDTATIGNFTVVCDRCSVNENVNFHTRLFFINSHISHHLKLEIALTIQASNDKKYNTNNSTGQGFNISGAILNI